MWSRLPKTGGCCRIRSLGRGRLASIGYRARTDTLEALKRAWNTLWMARHDEQAMREAAAAMISTLDHYLKDGTK